MRTIQCTCGKPVMHVEYGGPRDKANQVRDGLRHFITGQKGFGGLGTFFREPEGCSPLTGCGSTAQDAGARRSTAAMDGLFNV